METLRVLIVDDEPPAREGLRLLLARDPQIVLIGEAANGYEAVSLIQQQRPDLLFLDVQMPELGGFDVLEQLGEATPPAVIFVTAYDRYGSQAFEVQALDYLLKPFSDERFGKALQRAKNQLLPNGAADHRQRLRGLLRQRPATQPAPVSTPYLERVMVKAGGRVSFFAVEEIDWIEAADYYVALHIGRKTHLLRATIAQLETQLDPQLFLRIHRSAIVNLSKVREYQPHGNGEAVVILHDNTPLKLSRRRRKTLEAWLEHPPYDIHASHIGRSDQ